MGFLSATLLSGVFYDFINKGVIFSAACVNVMFMSSANIK